MGSFPVVICCVTLSSRFFRHRDGRRAAGALVFTLRGEDPDNQRAPPRTYVTISPQLIWSPMRKRLSRPRVACMWTHGCRTWRALLTCCGICSLDAT